jgi:hypothetical protein
VPFIPSLFQGSTNPVLSASATALLSAALRSGVGKADGDKAVVSSSFCDVDASGADSILLSANSGPGAISFVVAIEGALGGLAIFGLGALVVGTLTTGTGTCAAGIIGVAVGGLPEMLNAHHRAIIYNKIRDIIANCL